LKDMYIAVLEEGKKEPKYYPLEFVNEEVLKEVYPDLNIASIKGENGLRLHPDQWKKKDGKAFEMNMDNVFISDARETGDTIPLIAGFTRTDAKGKVKDISYQDNALNEHDLGTAVDGDMLEADEVNKIKRKLGQWMPDIIVTYPRAAATIAILPFILKNVFGLEKSKKPAPEAEVKEGPVILDAPELIEEVTSDKEVA
ncbi:MAG: hypothetical protein NC408_09990, partial [Candidatus Gastranaerophilales bacterium]|nr:hypothetical protein [Candidatus Gastranaerophilales bacterium]